MPRDLTDLMEAAVSAAPPETHHPADITQLAARRQRRRTSLIAGGAALAVIAAAGVTVGLTQHTQTTPEPTNGFLYDKTVETSSAVPAASVPGFDLEPWTIPSTEKAAHGLDSPTYRDVDADGRLVVVDQSRGNTHRARVRLFDGPGRAARPLQSPAGAGGGPDYVSTWIPSFNEPGQLLWARSLSVPTTSGIHLSDLDGGQDVFVPTLMHLPGGVGDGVTHPWVSGGRLWFTSYTGSARDQAMLFGLYTAPIGSQKATLVARNVVTASVDDGVVAWVTTSGALMTESASGGPQHQIPVPLPAGCRLPSNVDMQTSGQQYLAVDREVIALTEDCGSGDHSADLVAFDPSGRLLVRAQGGYALNPALGAHSVVFENLDTPALTTFRTLRYDLVSGSLTTLGNGATSKQHLQPVRAAGDNVLWYDASGGHVGHFSR